MELRVLYDGVPIGTTELPALAGLAHGELEPTSGFEIARPRVEAAAGSFSPRGPLVRRYWPRTAGDFADQFACGLAGGYELEELCGLRVSVASVVVITRCGASDTVAVVADFRPQSAQILAVLPDTHGDGGGRHRPAA